TLARFVQIEGVPMTQTGIWRIENGEPRRRIMLDEALAFARVFGLTLEELLTPTDVATAGSGLRDAFQTIQETYQDAPGWGGEPVTKSDLIQQSARVQQLLKRAAEAHEQLLVEVEKMTATEKSAKKVPAPATRGVTRGKRQAKG